MKFFKKRKRKTLFWLEITRFFHRCKQPYPQGEMQQKKSQKLGKLIKVNIFFLFLRTFVSIKL